MKPKKPKKDSNRDYQDKRKRLERGELECPRLRWVSANDRRHLIAAGYLHPADADDPDEVTAALDEIRALVFKNIRRARKTRS